GRPSYVEKTKSRSPSATPSVLRFTVTSSSVSFEAELSPPLVADTYKVITGRAGDSNAFASATYSAIPGARTVRQDVPGFGSVDPLRAITLSQTRWHVVILADGRVAAEASSHGLGARLTADHVPREAQLWPRVDRAAWSAVSSAISCSRSNARL